MVLNIIKRAKPVTLFVIGFILVTCITLSANSYANQTLRVAVAANFAPIAKKLSSEFTQQTGIQLEIISGASGALFQQIKHAAPYDMFLSADAIRPQALKDHNLIVENSLTTYAIGKLAFWSSTHKINNEKPIQNVLANYSRIAISNPKTAPYGFAAKQVLTDIQLWDSFKSKLITGINVNQTFQQIRSKSVKAGFIALSQLKLNNLNGIEIPQQHYAPIKQQLVILKRSKNINAAQQFSLFLKQKKTQQKIASFGYSAIMPADQNTLCCNNAT